MLSEVSTMLSEDPTMLLEGIAMLSEGITMLSVVPAMRSEPRGYYKALRCGFFGVSRHLGLQIGEGIRLPLSTSRSGLFWQYSPGL